jgi:hypothetical protein
VITSLRSAPSCLGNITTINLSHNRLDCLVGLERVLGLERIDVRGNELVEWQEVGRLAVLPHVKEVWCSGNGFDRPESGEEEWRVELGIEFAREGKEVIIDGKTWTWNESRRIEASLAQRGHAPHIPTLPQSREASTSSHIHPTHVQPVTSPATPGPSRLVSPASSALGKKRRPRRVINLDDDIGENGERQRGGSMRLPRREEIIHEDDEGEGRISGGTDIMKFKKKERRRVSTSMFEPAASTSETASGAG